MSRAALALILAVVPVVAQPRLSAFAGRSFTSFEPEAEILALSSARPAGDSTLVVLSGTTQLLNAPAADRVLLRVPAAALKPGDNTLNVVLLHGAEELARQPVVLRRLEPRPNEVKIDHLSGGLIVDRRPFFPFGFYCYSSDDSPQPHLAAEEAINGFNMLSPYQSSAPDLRANRRAYLDECARVGMRVHFNIVNPVRRAKDLKVLPETLKQVEDEVRALKDHPALLAWYISDEPEGWGESPETLQKVRDLIARVDPYHPVTIVIMSAKPAERYAAAMDIIMADPYPIPASSPDQAGQVPAQLRPGFQFRKPIWIVPQAFGGNEWWRREPTRAELRLMTWRAIQEGATGIQYFIRNGLNGFPKSTVTWAEASAVAHEVAELTPDLLSPEPRPDCEASPEPVKAAAWTRDGRVTVVLANLSKQPSTCAVKVAGLDWSGKAKAVFEDREVDVKAGRIEDLIDGYGTRVYQFQTTAPPPDRVAATPGNVVYDPSFEELAMPGVPSCCYVGVGEGHGATYTVESLDAVNGRHALRIHVPDLRNTCRLDPYGVFVPAGSYRASVWAKGQPLAGGTTPAQIDLRMGGFTGPDGGSSVAHHYALDGEWHRYVVYGGCTEKKRIGLDIKVALPGTVWLDLLEVVPDPLTQPEATFADTTEVTLTPPMDGAVAAYTLDGSAPTTAGKKVAGPIHLAATTTVKWLWVLDGKALSPVFTRVWRRG